MEALLELTASLSLEGNVTFPDPGALREGVPVDAVPSTPSSGAPAWPDVTALEEGSALPLALVVLGEDDVIPGVTRAPVGAPARDAGGGVSSGEREAALSGAAGGGRGGEEADMERLRKILRGLQVPPDGGAPLPAAGEEESDLAAVEALLRAGTRL